MPHTLIGEPRAIVERILEHRERFDISYRIVPGAADGGVRAGGQAAGGSLSPRYWLRSVSISFWSKERSTGPVTPLRTLALSPENMAETSALP